MTQARKFHLVISLAVGAAAVGLTWVMVFCDPSWEEGGDRLFFYVWHALNTLPTRLSNLWSGGQKLVVCLFIFIQWFIMALLLLCLADLLKPRRTSKRRHGR